MKSKKIWANFSVKDANRTRQFYTQLGFTRNKFNSDPKLASFLLAMMISSFQRNHFHPFCGNRGGSESICGKG